MYRYTPDGAPQGYSGGPCSVQLLLLQIQRTRRIGSYCGPSREDLRSFTGWIIVQAKTVLADDTLCTPARRCPSSEDDWKLVPVEPMPGKTGSCLKMPGGCLEAARRAEICRSGSPDWRGGVGPGARWHEFAGSRPPKVQFCPASSRHIFQRVSVRTWKHACPRK